MTEPLRYQLDGTTIRLFDEVDLLTAVELVDVINRLLMSGATHITFDLSGVSFIDSSGLGAMALPELSNCTTSIVGASDRVKRLLDTIGIPHKETP